MIPTRLDVKTVYRGLFDDDAGKVFTDTVFTNGFNQAYDALFQAFLVGQVPRIRNIVVVQITPGTTSLTPATAGVADFADYVMLRERLNGSSERFRQLDSREVLTQRTQTDRLLEFVWRLDTFFFIGATTTRDLEITYESSGTAPTDDGTSIGVDNSRTFLANFAAGVTGGRKGYDEIAQRCWSLAVGSKYDQGTMGGELFRLVQAKVRSEQKVQIAPRPFTTSRQGYPLWRAPFIAAPSGGSGTAPAQFSSALGTITGAIDGSNTQFFLPYPVSTASVYRNGDRLTSGTDYTFGANLITFAALQIPTAGDIITVDGWL